MISQANCALVILAGSIMALVPQSATAQSDLQPPALETTPLGSHSATPIGNPGAWVTTNDYPMQALRDKISGTVAFRLGIGSDGRVFSCTILSGSGSQELDTTTCQLVTARAQFEPARDVQGHAVAGTYSNRIRWIIPHDSDGPSQLVAQARTESFIVEADGSVSRCTSTLNGQAAPAANQNSPCASGQRVAPYHDSSGKAVRRKVTMTMTISVTDLDKIPLPRKKRHR